jgi:hypothetical protein
MLIDKNATTSSTKLITVLLNDAIQDLQNGDSTTAVVHLNLAEKQLSILDTKDTLQRNLTITSPIQQEQAITNNQSSMSVNQTTGPPFTTIPSNLTAQYIPPLSSPIPQQRPDWIRICNTLQSALLSPSNVLVNPDGTPINEGNLVVTCIRNGALLAAGAGLAAIPLDWIARGLQFLEGPTGCGSVVSWNMINDIGSVDTILNLIPG